MAVGKPETIGEMNKKLILDYLRKCGPQSRAELSRKLGMSFPAVSTNVEALLANGLIAVKDGRETDDIGTGRKPILFEYNAEWGYVAAIDLGRSRVRMMLCNLCGAVLETRQFELRGIADAALLEEIDRRFAAMLDEAGVPMAKLRCLSIGRPGIWDENSHRLELAPFLNETLRANRIDRYFEQKYGLYTTAENNVNLAAIAEKWQGAGVEYANIVYVDCAVGIGSALILGGELITGQNGAAGEIGFMLPGVAFRRRAYEEEGVLEKILGAYEIERRMALQSSHPHANTHDLFEGDDRGQWEPYLEDIKNYLAMTLVNLTAMINPELLIVGGGMGKALLKNYRPFFEDYLRAHVPYAPLLLESELDENATLLGAVAYALRQVHDDPALLH